MKKFRLEKNMENSNIDTHFVREAIFARSRFPSDLKIHRGFAEIYHIYLDLPFYLIVGFGGSAHNAVTEEKHWWQRLMTKEEWVWY